MRLLTFILALWTTSALAQTDLDSAYKLCRGHFVNHEVTVGGKQVMVLGYEPGWEKCGDIDQAYYLEAQRSATKASPDEQSKVLDLAKKLVPPAPQR